MQCEPPKGGVGVRLTPKDRGEPASAQTRQARVAWGTGVSHINVNRDRIDPKTQRWWEGPNYEGPSDKTVAVVKFETPGGERRTRLAKQLTDTFQAKLIQQRLVFG